MNAAPAPGEPAKRRILFVDDEVQLLDALANRLRKMRSVWEMVFVASAEEALTELGRAPFDVVVSDMRMPRIDGAALLAQVREKHPAAARIILSGDADPAAIARVLPVAHQVLSKPCSLELLKSVIERACSLRRLLADSRMRELVGRLDQLPSSPEVYQRLTSAMEDPGATPAAIARIVEQDVAMSAKILQLVNSPAFDLSAPNHGGAISSIEQAVSFLGLVQLRAIALPAHVFVAFDQTKTDRRLIDRLHRDALLTGRIARRLMPLPRDAEEALSTALVHDIGQTILASSFPAEYAQIFREAAKNEVPFVELERKYLGATHSQVGGYLLGMWGLPAPIVDAVSFHQEPQLVPGNNRLTAVIHVASAYVEAWLEKLPIAETRLDLPFLEQAGFAAELPAWHAIAEEELNNFRE